MIQAGFIVLTLIMAVAAMYIYRIAALKALPPGKAKPATIRTAVVLAVWLVYIFVISQSGIMATTLLPPRLPLLLVLPAFVFIAGFSFNKAAQPLVAAIPAAAITYLQAFRILVELLLYALSQHDLVPVSATFEGYNYEIIIGILALLMGYFGYTRRVLPRIVVILWNIAGLCTLAIIVFIFMTHAYAPALWDDGRQFSIQAFTSFPNTLLAAFLMPLAVFMHVLSLVKLTKTDR